MQLTYQIENYYPYESRIFVIYTPDDPAFEPLGGWVYITPEMTAQQIKNKVLSEAPLAKWEAVKSTAVADLIGQSDSGFAAPSIVPDPVPNPVIPPDPPTPEQIESRRQSALWQAAHMVEYNAISGSAIGLITIGIMQGKPKCTAVQAWIQTLWTEYYVRKAGGSTNYDFSAYDTCPHTVPELMQELGL